MTATRSAPASVGLRTPVTRFGGYETALEAMADYEAVLCGRASSRRSGGLTVTDQDQPEEAYCLFPARPFQPPLAIVGGMGPLAGAMAFRRACERFRNSRVLALYQACSMPDRSAVILSETGVADNLSCGDLASRLSRAVRRTVELTAADCQPVSCILACNSAHYFWNLLQDHLRSEALECVNMVSLVDSSLEALEFRSCRNVLVLTTEGARVGRVFSEPCSSAGIPFEEPSPALSRLLMRTIFEGIKALDHQRALELGNEFFERILETGRDYDCILAGCTEIPLTIELLKRRGNPAVAAFLSNVKIIDPLEEALCRA